MAKVYKIEIEETLQKVVEIQEGEGLWKFQLYRKPDMSMLRNFPAC